MYLAFYYFQKIIFKKDSFNKNLIKQTSFIIILIATLTIGILSINSGIIFAQEKMKHQNLMILLL
jgi:hypothetical protein